MMMIYQKRLIKLLGYYQWLVLGCFIILFAILILLFHMPSELSPAEDQGLLIAMSSAPHYTNTDFINDNAKDLMKQLRDFPDSNTRVTLTGIPEEHQALSFISLKDWRHRKKTAMVLQEKLQNKVNQVPGLQTIVINPSSLPIDSGLPLQIVLKSTLTHEDLYPIANEMIESAWESGLFTFIKSDLQYDQPTLKIEINKKLATILGISMQQISDTLNVMLGGNRIQQFTRNNISYFVIPQILPQYRINPKELYQIHLKTHSGKLVPLSSIATIIKTVEPEHLNQFQKFNSITISGEMAKNRSLDEGIGFFNQLMQRNNLSQVMLDFSGQTRQFIAEGKRMAWIFIAAFMIIFIVLAIQFESYRMPMIILLGTVPLAIFAACLVLWFGSISLNIYTQIGLLTLVGLISKHGILIVEFANSLQRNGLNKFEAIVKSTQLRFRPILMTTLSMVLGVMPLVFASGAGSTSRAAIGMVIAGGMLIGTCLVLFILPAIYLCMAPDLNKQKIGDSI